MVERLQYLFETRFVDNLVAPNKKKRDKENAEKTC